MKKLIVVADWAQDTLSQQEFRSSVGGFVSDHRRANIAFVPSSPSTVHTGFLVNQIALTEERFGHPLETVIFQNTDPRLQSPGELHKAQGAGFYIARLATGLHVCGPNAGYDFSFVCDRIHVLFEYRGLEKGSQFRSRDLFARVCAHLMDAMEDEMDLLERQQLMIPRIDRYVVGHIDNFGNIKTTVPMSALKGRYELHDMVDVRINHKYGRAKYVDNLFGEQRGVLTIYPGSSGDAHDPYLEIGVRQSFAHNEHVQTALDVFHHPQPGMEVVIG